jgi:putative transposase
MKYRPTFPKHFHSEGEARDHMELFFYWYNTEHRHSGIGYMTPQSMHDGSAAAIQARRLNTMQQVYSDHAERFVSGPPRPPPLPTAAYINPPRKPASESPTAEPGLWEVRPEIL